MSTKKKKRNSKNIKKKNYVTLFHLSAAPRKYLQPRRTTYSGASYDKERWDALLFLCPFRELSGWSDWVLNKFPKSKYKMVDDFYMGKHVTLYVHVVRVKKKDLIIPRIRWGNEFVIKKTIRPKIIVPVRFYHNKTIDLSKVRSRLKCSTEKYRFF